MEISPSLSKLEELIRHQINSLFLLEKEESEILVEAIPAALIKVEICFRASTNKYYKKNGKVFFSIYHSGQYCIFLYFLSREIYLAHSDLNVFADKIYYLNKALNGLDLFYEVVMPNVFNLDHPVGTVLGRANYGEGFTFSQLCTVGNNKGAFPNIGTNVTMYSGSKILGLCNIGDNVDIAANTYIKDTDIPSNSTVFGVSPNLIVRKKRFGRL